MKTDLNQLRKHVRKSNGRREKVMLVDVSTNSRDYVR
jgi:hypothetical protein